MNPAEKWLYRKLNVPLIIVVCYLMSTVMLYVIGPWGWKTRNPLALYSMLFGFVAALVWGYKRGLSGRVREAAKDASETGEPTSASETADPNPLLRVLLCVNLIFVTLNTIDTSGLSSLSLGDLYDDVIAGFADPATHYIEKKNREGHLGGSLLTYSNVLLAPLLWMSVPLSIYYFKKLPLVYQAISVVTIALEVSRWVAIGTNKGLIDVLIILFAITCVRRLQWSSRDRATSRRADSAAGKRFFVANVKVATAAGVLLLVGLYFFTNAVGDRVGAEWRNLEISSGVTPIRHDSPLMRVCPSALEGTLILATSYLTQGYYALSLTSVADWVPMFGVGHSMFLMENIGPVLGVDLYDYTYQTRMAQYGWDPLVNWHSFYVWVANDVTVFGVVIVMYVLGKYFAQISYDAIMKSDNVAIVLFCLLFIMFLYIPANNQVLSYPTTCMAFWVLTGVWYTRRRRTQRLGRRERMAPRPSRGRMAEHVTAAGV